MANMLRIRVTGTGWTGGPGLSTFYFDPGASTIDPAMITGVTGRVRQYFDALKAFTRPAVGWTVDPVAAVINPATGVQVSDMAAGSSPSVVVGTGPGDIGPPFVAAVGLLKTQAFIRGRRLQGRTFYSPLCSDFTDSQNIEGGLQTAVVSGLNLMLTSGGGPLLCVWSRPVGGSGGNTAAVTTVACSSRYGVIKSRR